MNLSDSHGQTIQLGQVVGQGGEATIYEIRSDPELLAKLYTDQPRPGYESKLAWMLAHPPQDPTLAQGHASIAWPRALLFDAHQQVVGYLMPYIQGAVPLLDVFNPRRRSRTLPGFDRRYLYRTARNLAVTVAAVHAQGYIIGDTNESNVLVTPSAMVTLIDTDSFQVTRQEETKQTIFPCPVGKPEYTAPELQGQSFQETIQQSAQDCFGLGVLIFQLLMEGSHPFRARWLAAGDPPPIEERIRQGCFPHVARPSCPVAIPASLPKLDQLSPQLVSLMRRCFVEGHHTPTNRPPPESWSQAIVEAEQSLTRCEANHYYPQHLSQCPDCAKLHRQQTQRLAAARRRLTPQLGHPQQTTATTISKTLAVPMPRTRRSGRSMTAATAAQSQQIWVKCPACGYNNLSTEIYCQHCTQQLCSNRDCTYCHQPTPTKAQYCPHCGNSL